MRRAAVAIACAGATATLLVSLALPVSTHEAVRLALAAGGAAAAAGVLGALLLSAARRMALAVQATLVALTPVAAVIGGALAASRLMFASTHPLAALGVVLVSAGTVGILTSLVPGARLRAGSARLITAARQIGDGDLRTRVEQPPVEELAALARELEAMQTRLEQSRARERSLAEARRELVAWISHDLRTPVARIRAIVEALADGVLHELDRCLPQLQQETERLGTLIADLFELSRINARELALEVQPVRVSEIVSDLVSSFSVVARARQVELNATPPTYDPEIDASPTHLERALGNLLDNAVRYTEPGGVVDVTIATRAPDVLITIDDGCGGADFPRLDRLISQADGNTDGGGLGLAIAKGLIEAHAGRITLEPTARGCRFSIILPERTPPRRGLTRV